MIQDESSKEAIKKNTKGSSEGAPAEANLRTPSEKPTETLNPHVSAPHPPQDPSSHDAGQIHEPSKRCVDQVSVKLVKTESMTPFESRTLALGGFTLLVLILTFIIFALQLRESRKQTAIFQEQARQATLDALKAREQADSQFRADQRPVVWLANDPKMEIGQFPTPQGTQLLWDVRYTNFGKSAAYELRQGHHCEFGSNALSRIKKPKLSKDRMFLPPGKTDFITLVTSPLDASSIIASYKDYGLVFWFRSQYEDSIGNRYESNLCMAHLQAGGWQYCAIPGSNNIQQCSASNPCDEN